MVRESGVRRPNRRIAINTRVITKMIKNVELVFLLGNRVTCTMGAIKMMRDTGTEKCNGLMVHATKESGLMVFSMELVQCLSQMEESKKDTLKITCISSQSVTRSKLAL